MKKLITQQLKFAKLLYRNHQKSIFQVEEEDIDLGPVLGEAYSMADPKPSTSQQVTESQSVTVAVADSNTVPLPPEKVGR